MKLYRGLHWYVGRAVIPDQNDGTHPIRDWRRAIGDYQVITVWREGDYRVIYPDRTMDRTFPTLEALTAYVELTR